jgi:hypothetical protein
MSDKPERHSDVETRKLLSDITTSRITVVALVVSLIIAFCTAGVGYKTFQNTAESDRQTHLRESQKGFLEYQLGAYGRLVNVTARIAQEYDRSQSCPTSRMTSVRRPAQRAGAPSLSDMPSWSTLRGLWDGEMAIFEDEGVYYALKRYMAADDLRRPIACRAMGKMARMIAQEARRAVKKHWGVSLALLLDAADTHYAAYDSAASVCTSRARNTEVGWLDFENTDPRDPGVNIVHPVDEETAKKYNPDLKPPMGTFICEVRGTQRTHSWSLH